MILVSWSLMHARRRHLTWFLLFFHFSLPEFFCTSRIRCSANEINSMRCSFLQVHIIARIVWKHLRAKKVWADTWNTVALCSNHRRRHWNARIAYTFAGAPTIWKVISRPITARCLVNQNFTQKTFHSSMHWCTTNKMYTFRDHSLLPGAALIPLQTWHANWSSQVPFADRTIYEKIF